MCLCVHVSQCAPVCGCVCECKSSNSPVTLLHISTLDGVSANAAEIECRRGQGSLHSDITHMIKVWRRQWCHVSGRVTYKTHQCQRT